jgi:hypothetical protein
MSPTDTADTRDWTALKATVGTASVTGLDSILTATVTDASIAVNRASTGASVVDFTSSFETSAGAADGKLAIPTGQGTDTVDLDFDQELIQATGTFNMSIAGFVNASGTLAFKFTKQDVRLRTIGGGLVATPLAASVIEIGGDNLTATIGEVGSNDISVTGVPTTRAAGSHCVARAARSRHPPAALQVSAWTTSVLR